jgi:hypothetical protein
MMGGAEERDADLDAVVRETQKVSTQDDEIIIVWWIPQEFWELTLKSEPTSTEERSQQALDILRPYTIVLVVDGKFGPFGGVTYKSETEIQDSLRLRDNEGGVYLPLPPEKVNPDAKNFLSMMRPIFANMLGPMGENMHFFLFPAQKKNGQPICDALKKGALSLELGERKFRWRLPLGSLLPPKICPHCQEKCSGAWNYCPWCGNKLPE